jgi:hypothetical protein
VNVPDVRFAFASGDVDAALVELCDAGRRSYTYFRVADLMFPLFRRVSGSLC